MIKRKLRKNGKYIKRGLALEKESKVTAPKNIKKEAESKSEMGAPQYDCQTNIRA